MLSAHRVTKKLQGICQNQGNKNQRLGFLTFKSEEYLPGPIPFKSWN